MHIKKYQEKEEKNRIPYRQGTVFFGSCSFTHSLWICEVLGVCGQECGCNHCCWVHLMSTVVMFCEMCLYKDDFPSAQLPKSKLVGLHELI